MSATLRRPNEIVTASNSSSPNGSRSASPPTKAGCGPSGWARTRVLPARSMPMEKSQATQSAPDAANVMVEVPVPAARSRIRSPARAATARATTRRQSRTWPAESRSFIRS